jgi:hypothetical protein
MRRHRPLASDRATTDPLLVIAAIAVSLVLLVGGKFTVKALVANGHNARSARRRVGAANGVGVGVAAQFSKPSAGSLRPVGGTSSSPTITTTRCGWSAPTSAESLRQQRSSSRELLLQQVLALGRAVGVIELPMQRRGTLVHVLAGERIDALPTVRGHQLSRRG